MSVVGLEVAAAVDLRRLATLCGCTVADLTRGAQTPGDITAVGVVAEPRQEVLFEQNRVATEPEQELGGATAWSNMGTMLDLESLLSSESLWINLQLSPSLHLP